MKANVLLFELALTFYFFATAIGIIELFRKIKKSSWATLYLTITGFLFHTANIIVRYAQGGHLPAANLHEAASFLSWCILIIFFYHEYRYKIGLLSSFIMPVVFILMLSSSVFPREITELSPVLESSWFSIHVTLAFLGDAAFAMAFGIGIMYIIQERYVKSKHLSSLFQRLPSLQSLDEINYHLITLGFPLLTLAMITGAIWARSAWGTYWRWDPKEVWSLITWLIYALVLHLRLTVGWRGKKAAILSIAGFLLVIFTFLGVTLLLKGIHVFE
ncbi:MAG: c-type cytochrome biogenesis protein CcsB [Nitrospirae bacterium]|nr:c-type cytochrome biogenesis protein CcsB [Nitrospirota bacterium]